MEAKFILSKKAVLEQCSKLKNLGVSISYSYKTNREVGNILQELAECPDCSFSLHNIEEIGMIKNKNKIFFFPQAWRKEEIRQIVQGGVRMFVIDNEADLKELVDFLNKNSKDNKDKGSKEKIKVDICLRMKIQEHRIGSGKYFIYGMPAKKVNKIISELSANPLIGKIGIHIHRKSQNTSEWNIKAELEDSLADETLKKISFAILGGGLPVEYKSYSSEVLPYIFSKIKEAGEWLAKHNIKAYIEPGRFIAAPSVRLQAEIIQVYDSIIVINCSLYNCALDTLLTNTKMLVQGELPDSDNSGISAEGQFYLIKGNTPTRDDIFRYKVKLKAPKVGDKIVFLNAGAYNYATDFCSLQKLKTEVREEF